VTIEASGIESIVRLYALHSFSESAGVPDGFSHRLTRLRVREPGKRMVDVEPLGPRRITAPEKEPVAIVAR
jgi:hypothetical protein